MILIKEIFYSIQGEGLFAGTPMVFVRTGKCNLSCAFCDTNYTDDLIPMEAGEVATKILSQFSQHVDTPKLHVCFTGGEPSLWPLGDVIEALAHQVVNMENRPNMTFYVETNGLHWEKWMEYCHITVSPKTPLDKLSGAVLCAADCVKFLYGVRFPRHFEDKRPRQMTAARYLQPIWDDDYEINLAGAVNYVKKHPEFCLSLQLHKYIGEP